MSQSTLTLTLSIALGIALCTARFVAAEEEGAMDKARELNDKIEGK